MAERVKKRKDPRGEQYASDVVYRDTIKARSREAYWKGKDKPEVKVFNGLLEKPTTREVYRYEDPDSEYIYVGCYTMQEAADALGKTLLTVKRWVAESLIPYPILKCSSHQYLVYSEGELQLIAEFLAKYSKARVYLSRSDTSELEALRQRLEGYRLSQL